MMLALGADHHLSEYLCRYHSPSFDSVQLWQRCLKGHQQFLLTQCSCLDYSRELVGVISVNLHKYFLEQHF